MPTPTVETIARPNVRGSGDGQGPASSWFGVGFSIAVFVATRALDALMLKLLAVHQQALSAGSKPGYFEAVPMRSHPSYWEVITNWDGQWYQSIAAHGYPALAGGSVDAQQAWAFPPGFPWLVRGLMTFGLSFPMAASLLNLGCGMVAMILLFDLVERAAGRFSAIAAVATTCCFITAPLLQAAYSESLAFMLLLIAFRGLTRGRYGATLIAVLLLSLVRVITPPFALVVVAHVLYRRRRRESIARKDALLLTAITGSALAGGVVWTGASRLLSHHASLATARTAGPFDGQDWFGQAYQLLGWTGIVMVLLLVAGLLVLARRPAAQGWGVELRTWLWCYPLYIFAATPITTGVLRYLLLCFPLGLALAGAPLHPQRAWQSAARLGSCCAAGLALQWWWLGHSFVVHVGSFMP